MSNAHQYATAVPVLPDGQSTFDPGLVSVVSGFDDPETAPPGITLDGGYRAFWYTYVPSADATIHAEAIAVDVPQQNVLPVTVTSWQVVGGVWTQTGTVTGTGYSGINPMVTAGRRTYLRISSSAAAVGYYRLVAQYLPPTGTAGPDPGSPVQLAVTGADTAGATDTVSGLPTRIRATDTAGATDTVAGVGAPAQTVDAGPADVGVDTPAPALLDCDLQLTGPPDRASLGTATPAFLVTMTTADPTVGVQVQYDTDPAFPAPTVLAGAGVAGLDDAQVSVYAGTALPDQRVYCWRARAVTALSAGPWTAYRVFAVNLLEGQAVAFGSFTVTTATTAGPHLWYLDPDGDEEPGGTATAVGTGFGPTPTVTLGGQPCEVLAVAAVPADPAAGAGIDPAGGAGGVYHEVVSFTIPADYDPDSVGDTVTVGKA